MKRKIINMLLVLVLLASFSMITAVPVAAATLNVPSVSYPTISSAVAAANPGDTIVVASGGYIENVNVNKAGLILQGAKAGVPAGPDQFPINRGGPPESMITGTVTLAADNITIDGFTIISSGNGINITGKASIIKNNILQKAAPTGAARGIYSGGADNFLIINNNIQGYQGGIFLDGGPNNIPVTIDGNYVRGATVWAILLLGSMANGNIVRNNLSEYNLLGIAMGQGGNQITNNIFRHNSSTGIYMSRAAFSPADQGNQIIGNTIDHNAYGIYNDGGEGGDVLNNHAAFNVIYCNTKYGVYNNQDPPFYAENNWWGCNNGPGLVGPGGGDKTSANVIYDPWLVLSLTANPPHVPPDGVSISTITADMTRNSNGAIPSGGFIPDGTAITFTTDNGSIVSPALTANGIATTTFTSSVNPGPANISAQGPTCSDCPGPSTNVDVNYYADLAVTKTVDNPIPLPGGQVTFTLTVTNNGADTANNVIVTDTYPSGFSFISAVPSPDALTDNQWTFTSLAYQAEQTITINGTVSKDGGCQTNIAEVKSDSKDEILSNNAASVDVNPLKIMVSKIASPAVACAGQDVLFTVIVYNLSCVDLKLVSFTDTQLGDISSHFQPILPAGAARSWSYNYTLQATDPDPFVDFVIAHYQAIGSAADITDTGSVAVRCSPVVGGEVAYDQLSGMLLPLFGLIALVIGGGLILGFRRKQA